ncbi:hypothetical protein OOK13_40440 [Streptomyces sp. NBC_00378]|uniref:hypothetical protein n=1 Tax=unclassified Streptomyces TaxID=2593676 RepID=UPI0022578925|nr:MULTISPECIES: hypothetical protein [unclassified Streptomyces]MCX5112173.1 hypothetical protein [Streptomyces sp. NBC_00378]MCX5114632.1 hypothetical protein [Streptomyces sp. NBC_00378]
MNAPMTPARLAEILARAEAATPGPWCTDSWEIYQGAEYEAGAEWIGETCRGVAGAADLEQDRATASFVASARTDVPDLVAVVRLLTAERDGLRAQVTGLERSAVLAEEDYQRIVRGACLVESQLRARIAELEALQLGSVDGRMSATCDNPEHPTWLRAADDTRSCPWCVVAELEAAQAAAIADRDAQIIAWLGKKSREYRSTGSRQHALQADAIDVMASKISRGAVRPAPSAAPAEDQHGPVSFAELAVGHRVRFVTADNGFGGMGEVWRTGTITRITTKTIAVDCDENLLGDTAVLRDAEWSARAVHRAPAEDPHDSPLHHEYETGRDLPSMTADEWNERYPVGTPVLAYPGTRDDEPLDTVTRTPAWTLGHGAAVVSVEGEAGGIHLTHVDPMGGGL